VTYFAFRKITTDCTEAKEIRKLIWMPGQSIAREKRLIRRLKVSGGLWVSREVR
jgi:hypothetical protein